MESFLIESLTALENWDALEVPRGEYFKKEA
jgi:hypothetical protein